VRNYCGAKQRSTVHPLSKASEKGLRRGRDGFAAQVEEVKPILNAFILIGLYTNNADYTQACFDK
jgi:hypothetical protein